MANNQRPERRPEAPPESIEGPVEGPVEGQKLRVFLDANILIRGVTFPRFPYEVLRHAAKGDFIPVFSPMVLDSARLYVRELFPDHQEALEVLLTLLEHELVLDPSPEEVAAHANLMRDARDIPVALAAIHAQVDYLVSTDRDFTDVDDTTAELRRHLKLIQIGSFLREIMGWASEALSAIERRRWSDLEQPFWEERENRS
jgi:predicted nucleic acid-binding protein